MATTHKKPKFLDSEEAVSVKQILRLMTNDATYNTNSTYTSSSEQYPNNLIPFIDKHMNYLQAHPDVDPTQYIANLRLMTRLKVKKAL